MNLSNSYRTQYLQRAVKPKTLKWSNITTIGMKNILQSTVLEQEITKGILRCKQGRSVKPTFSCKGNYQEVIKDWSS